MGEILNVIRYPSEKFKVLYPEHSVGKKYIVLKGGRASTKSWSVARALIDHACTYNGLRVVCGREIMKSIQDSSKKLLEDTITRAGLWSEFKTTASYIENTRTKATFKFIGLRDNPESVKGLEGVDIFWGEEADSFSEESLDLLCPSMRKAGCKVIFTYNPQLPTTPVEKLQITKREQCVVRFINYLEVTDYLSDEVLVEAEQCRLEDPDKYRWIWLGEFRSQSQDTFIPLGYVTGACARDQVVSGEGVVAGLDIGLFHDRSVMVVRQGPNVLYAQEWKNIDNLDLCQRVIGLCVKWKVQRLAVDKMGQGGPVYQNLRKELEETVVGIEAGSVARNQKKYSRLRDEAWGRIRDWLPTASLKGAGRIEDWVTDLTNIKFFYDDRGRYKLESKRVYISRGFPSTDWADALGYSLLVKPDTDASEYALPDAGRGRELFSAYDDSCGDWMGL